MIGTLTRLSNGRWGIVALGNDQAHELTSGDVFAVEIGGEMRITRMEFIHDCDGGRYVSADDYPLRVGLRAATGNDARPCQSDAR